MSMDNNDVDDRSKLKRNTLWNLFGIGLPLVVAIFSIPILLEELGIERFGILTMVWAIIGYFGIFDLGLGRAMTRSIAASLYTSARRISEFFSTAIFLMALLGICGGFILFILRADIVILLHLSEELKNEVTNSIAIISMAIPLIIISNGIKGLLEARQRFDVINWIRLPSGVLTYLLPLLLISLTHNLFYLVSALIGVRLVFVVIQAICALKVLPEAFEGVHITKTSAQELIKFGGWVTVSNIINPIILYFDRFFLAGITGVAAVAYYSTSLEVATKLTVVPSSLSSAIFPSFSSTLNNESDRANRLFLYGLRYNTLFLFPLVLLLVIFAYWGLTIWIGEEFSERSFRILQVLGIGVFLNGMATLPYAYIHGLGRADITAKIHLVEFIIYIPVLIYLIHQYGALGAAISWTLRVGIDSLVLFMIVRHYGFKKDSVFRLRLIEIVLMLISIIIVLSFPTNNMIGLGYFAICLLLHVFVVWKPNRITKRG